MRNNRIIESSNNRKKTIRTFSLLLFTFSLACACGAAVTQRWTVETSRVQPAVFDAVHGETLELEAAFQSYGKAVAMPTNGWCILWQTNGMGSAWWQEPAEVERKVKVRGEGEQSNGSSSSTNYQLLTTNYVVKAAFTPAMDPGADTVIGFLGATGQNYRASFRIRFRHGPGERPNTISAPVPILDLAHTTVINPPWPTAEDFAATTTVMKAELKDYVDGQIECAGIVTPQSVTNIAFRVTSNVVTKAYVEGLGISGGGGADTNAVNAIIASSNLCTKGYADDTFAKSKERGLAGVVGKEILYGSTSVWGVNYAGATDYAKSAGNATTATSIREGTIGDYKFLKFSGDALVKYNNYTPVETNAWISDVVSAVNDKADASAIIAATNALATTTAAKIVGATNNLHATQIKTSVDSYSSSFETVEDTLQSIGYALDALMVTDNMLEEGKANANQVYTQSESNQRFYPKASGDAWAAFWDGDEVRVTVTNYFGQADLPHLYLEQKTNTTGTAKYKIVWDEHTRWRKFVGDNFNWSTWSGFYNFKTNATARLDDLDANKADRAWGFYDSSTGEYAPEHYTSVSSSNLMIAAGLAYQRTVTTGGAAVWVLTATEPTSVSGTGNGAFQIKDADGNVQVEIVKGDKRTVGARCGGVSVSGTALVAEYAVASAEHPTLEVCADLANPVWKAEGTTGCPATVAWSGTSGAWVATITPSAGATKIFAKASYQVGGDSVFKSNVAMKFAQIVIGSTTYNIGTATVSGNTVLTLTPAL